MSWSSSRHKCLLLSVVLMVCLNLLPVPVLARPSDGASNGATARQGTGRLFQETGKTVQGRFLEYWEQNGGLARQGFPISEEMQEKSDTDGKTYTVQYFERAVFELHPQNQPPYDVLLQLLGVFRYKEKFDSQVHGQKPSTTPGAEKFPQTGKTVGGKFLDYWKRNGGLAQFGYPISDEFEERSPLDGKDYAVQYFERAVFELHPQNQPPYDVLLAQLGTFRWRARPVDPKTLTPEFRPDIPDGEYLPLYPGAVIKSTFEESYSGRIDRGVRYQAPGDVDEVLAFYDVVMPAYGWKFLYSVVPYDRHYSWTDPKGIVPWHLELDLSVTGVTGGGQSNVSFNYWRYPDASKIPIYPDARDLEVSTGQSGPPWPASCSDTVTNTTFLTTATPADVDSFYRSALSPHGWKLLSSSASIETAEGIQFLSDHTRGFRREGARATWSIRRLSLTLTALVRADGLTRITIVLETCDFNDS